jgi:hypothetical protein
MFPRKVKQAATETEAIEPPPDEKLNIIHGPNGLLEQLLQNVDMTRINTTAIGNMAWIANFHTNEEVQRLALLRLKEIREYFGRFQH